MNPHNFLTRPAFAALLLLLTACGGDGPGRRVEANIIHDAIPRAEPRSRQGNPEFYQVNGKRYFVLASSQGYRERGIASWYGKKFHGRSTSSGEIYDMYAMTAAHKTLPLPCYAEVTNLSNGYRAVVRINDRGPFHDNRIIDLSYAAALKLDIVNAGTGLVEVRVIDPKNPRQPQQAMVSANLQDDARFRNRIFIQLGAFGAKQNAERLLQELIGKRFSNVQIIAGDSQMGPVHRVRIGPLHTVTLTDDTARQLEQLGYSEYQIVID